LVLFALLFLLVATSLTFAVDFNSKWQNSLKPKGAATSTITLSKDSKTDYTILISSNPTTMDVKAAADLAMWLKEMTGAEFPVVKESVVFKPGAKVISIGKTLLYSVSGIDKPKRDLSRDGYMISVKDSAIFILGGKKRGIVDGVYSLLEEDLGCRWYAPGTQTIPHRSTLKFKPVSRTYVPILEDRRDPYYADTMFDIDWSLRNKTRSRWALVPAEWGGHPRFFRDMMVHSFNAFIPPGVFLKSNPEYFSLVKGVRQPFQQCLTNPVVLQMVIDQVRNGLREDPSIEIVEISPNDGYGYCECENCKKISDAEGTQMGPLLQFLNKVSDAIIKEFPDVKINTLAYLDTITPPKTIRPRSNISFWLCTDAYAWGKPNEFAWETKKLDDALKGWSKVHANMIIWDYPSNFTYMVPNINMPVHQKNLAYYIKHGATGVMYQCAHAETNFGADHSFMRSWVWAKQLWDPSKDTRALTRDFNYGYYGAAGEYMQKYDDMLWNAWGIVRMHWKEKTPPNPIDKAFVAKGWELMKQAEAAAAGDPELLKRIKTAQMPLMYMKATYGQGNDTAGYLALLDDFEKTARAAGVTNVENAFQGPDIDKIFAMWRKMAATDLDKVGYEELNNEWKFSPDKNNVGMDSKWFATDFDDSSWAKIRSDTGGGWDTQGFSGIHGWGWYRQVLDIPADMISKEALKILFLAIDEEAEVFINGQRACDHTVASTGRPVEILWTEPFMLDPTPFIHPGKNVIAVRVHDTMGMAGIWKPAYFAWGKNLDTTTFEEIMKRKKEAAK